MAADSALHRHRPQPDDGTTTVTLPPLPAQPRSSRYKILKLHGRGGMGEIWLAEDEHIGRQVAFKRIRADKEQVLERFFAEAQVTGQLEHPGIVPVHELGRDQDNQPFYVMRLIQGRTLKEVIAEFHAANKRGEPDEELRWLRLLGIVVSLCRTISFAHSRGVIHRDLKPDNVMVGQYGETFVLDWGLCKLMGQSESPVRTRNSPVNPIRLSDRYGSSATQDGEIVGSPLYMSPEMADGRIAEEDVRTDVYLLGATLYEVLTNRPPRAGSTHQEIVDLARTSPPVPPRKINPRVPPVLEAICLKAMEYRNDDRYESAQDVADEIERYLAGEPVKAYPEPYTRRLWRWAVRRRAAIARGALAAVVLIVAAGSLAAWQNERVKRQAEAKELATRKTLDEARTDASRFRELEETLHDQLADTTPLDERVGVTDPAAAEATWKKIQEIIAHWKPGLEDFPPEADKAGIQKAYAELALWRVQSMIAQPLNTESAESLLADLEAIAVLRPAPYSYQRLRAACLVNAGKSTLAEQALVLSKQLRQGAFDHFLEGEQKRMEALAQVAADESEAIGRPSQTFLQEAIQQYQKCLELDPQQFWAHLQKGRSHLVHREEIDAALAEFNLAAALRPESPTARSARGLALGILGKFTAAMPDLNHAVNVKGRSPTALLNRGGVFLLQGENQFANAQNDFLAVQKEDPQNLQAAYYLALLNYQQQKFAQALLDCKKVLQRDPALRPARLLRLQIDLAQGNGQQALADLALLSSSGTALEQAAGRCGLLRRLAARQAKPGKLLALTLAEQEGLFAVNGGLKTALLFDDLGAVQWNLNKRALALDSYERGLACVAAPRVKAALHRHRGLALALTRKWDRAKEDYRQAIELGGSELNRAEAHAMLGYIAGCQSDTATADRETALAMAQLRTTNHYDLWWNLGCVYAALSQGDSGNTQELQEIAMTMLENCIFQAERTGGRDDAVAKLRDDPALQPLRERQDFKALIAPPAAP